MSRVYTPGRAPWRSRAAVRRTSPARAAQCRAVSEQTPGSLTVGVTSGLSISVAAVCKRPVRTSSGASRRYCTSSWACRSRCSSASIDAEGRLRVAVGGRRRPKNASCQNDARRVDKTGRRFRAWPLLRPKHRVNMGATGTLVNDRLLDNDEEVLIKHGHIITFGRDRTAPGQMLPYDGMRFRVVFPDGANTIGQ
eukprot:scaffold28222_cov89-Phaeocystis_antarctica.AAC.1